MHYFDLLLNIMHLADLSDVLTLSFREKKKNAKERKKQVNSVANNNGNPIPNVDVIKTNSIMALKMRTDTYQLK